ncbi:NAD(P)/FAD-dependent oxidoreductase [Flavobacterium sp. '19STA2R22 D10 B1']|uniref:NAD(P)/FAD-dependent oxidoreductase n=1 Tax=Flavobacterium aerium TaxID=3037261 RepID=UPI00278C5C08|nr:FAD-dependent oxidoreductase [Flavobacterium sp. '19STA2R22 D10 B1']
MIDYLIVGSGLAGISFSEVVLKNNKTLCVFNDNSQQSSQVAGGLYNPVILKRFSEVWQAQEQITLLDSFYAALGEKLGVQLDFKMPILRKFFSVEEQNNWFIAADKPLLSPFLSVDLINKKYNNFPSPFGFGEVLQTGYVETGVLVEAYKKYLKSIDSFIEGTFDYDKLQVKDGFVQYEDIKARHIIFAEGFGMLSNPFFKELPLDGTKGELLIIKAPDLDIDVVIKTSVFILPLGNHLYKVGATYNWKDKTNLPTEEGKLELVEKIKELIDCDFEIVEHLVGVRPTVKDRRPLLGTHAQYANIHILNGLGTRGVMLGPAMAQRLYDFIEFQKPLEREINISRFV